MNSCWLAVVPGLIFVVILLTGPALVEIVQTAKTGSLGDYCLSIGASVIWLALVLVAGYASIWLWKEND